MFEPLFSTILFISDGLLVNALSPSSGYQDIAKLTKNAFGIDEIKVDKTTVIGTQKTQNYVSRSAVALRCRVMPPPCIKNPYQKDALEMDIDPFGNQRAKCAGTTLVIFQINFSTAKCFWIVLFHIFCLPLWGRMVLPKNSQISHFTVVIT